MIPDKFGLLKGNIGCSFEPLSSSKLVLSDWKDRYLHTLVKEICIFDYIEKMEPSDSWKSVPEPEEKPDVVAVGVYIILDQEIVLGRLLLSCIEVSSTKVTALKIRVNIIPTSLVLSRLFQLLEWLPVIVSHRI